MRLATAQAIIPAFLDFALSLTLEVVLLQVLARVTPPVTEGTRHIVVNPLERLQQEAEAYLGRYADGLCARGLSARTAVRIGDAATEIVQGAHEYQADLIAMTTHGRSGLSRLLFGSVAEAVLRRTSVPVFSDARHGSRGGQAGRLSARATQRRACACPRPFV